MTTAIGVAADGVRIPMARARVVAIARAVLTSERTRDAMLSISFVSNRAIRALNRKHLRRDRVTDVIAFSFRAGPGSPAVVGDIYIAPDVARAAAREHGIPIREEVTRLIVHGTLHALGHEHPERGDREGSPMWRRQERLVKRLAGRDARKRAPASRSRRR